MDKIDEATPEQMEIMKYSSVLLPVLRGHPGTPKEYVLSTLLAFSLVLVEQMVAATISEAEAGKIARLTADILAEYILEFFPAVQKNQPRPNILQ